MSLSHSIHAHTQDLNPLVIHRVFYHIATWRFSPIRTNMPLLLHYLFPIFRCHPRIDCSRMPCSVIKYLSKYPTNPICLEGMQSSTANGRADPVTSRSIRLVVTTSLLDFDG